MSSSPELQEDIKSTFRQLYEEYMPRVYRYIRFKVNDVALTEDITSTVFEKALVNFNKYSKDKASFATWLFTIARNVVIDYYRTTKQRETVTLDDSVMTMTSRNEPSPNEDLEKKEEKEYLRSCLLMLSNEEQEIIRLKFGAELSNRQIARITSMSESNVGTKLYRAVKKLRDSFQEQWHG